MESALLEVAPELLAGWNGGRARHLVGHELAAHRTAREKEQRRRPVRESSRGPMAPPAHGLGDRNGLLLRVGHVYFTSASAILIRKFVSAPSVISALPTFEGAKPLRLADTS